nr:integrase, catalytic region, zinc finger, CCHC-type, peptidase aspartic, catalytic [Tanacetum cinerariifolium]
MSAGSSRPFTSGSGGTSRRQRVIICYNCKGEGHMAKQCTKPKRKRDAEWFKDKVLLVQAQASGQTESSAEQAFWSQYSVQTDEPNLSGTTTVEVPKELPKVSMVNSYLKKLKFHLASIDMVVKERTTATAITEGTWGFEHTKACFRDDIIPFVKSLKELFTSFDQCLIDEVTKVQNVFTQMELAVEQHCEEKSKVQTKMENVLQENDRLLTQALSVEIVNITVHDNVKFVCLNVNACARCVTTETELKTDFLKKKCYDTLLQKYHTLEKHCITLEANNQSNTKIFQRDTWSSQERALTFAELFEINNLKAQAQAKDTVDVTPVVPKLRKNRTAHNDYIRHTQEEAATLRKIVERVNLVSSASGSMSQDNTKNNRIRQTQKKAKKNKVEDHLRTVKSSLNKASVVDSKATSSVLNSVNDHVAKIMGYGDYQIGNVTISRVYYVEGLGHNLFSVGQFCDLDLEVAFR